MLTQVRLSERTGPNRAHTTDITAETLAGMNVERAFVIHGEPGWDEPTPVGPFLLLDVCGGRVLRREEDPLQYGIPRCSAEDLRGGDAVHNAIALREVFQGRQGAHRDALVLGAALVLRLLRIVPEPRAAAGFARQMIDDGAALDLLDKTVRCSRVLHVQQQPLEEAS